MIEWYKVYIALKHNYITLCNLRHNIMEEKVQKESELPFNLRGYLYSAHKCLLDSVRDSVYAYLPI